MQSSGRAPLMQVMCLDIMEMALLRTLPQMELLMAVQMTAVMEMRATSVMVPVMEATAVKVTDTQTAVRIAKGILAATQANNGENKRL